MCGISGFISPNQSVDPSLYYNCHRRLEHRGRDDEGLVHFSGQKTTICRGANSLKEFQHLPLIQELPNPEIALGHHRLSIIDLTAAGHQPFHFNGLWIVYNGEIYNYLEIREILIKNGYEFQTRSDTEVLLKAWDFWGSDAFSHFNGMWAFCIYDTRVNKLFLSRDRFGEKPLFYAKQGGDFYFASEAKFFKDLVKLSLNQAIVSDYLVKCRVDHDQATMFEDIAHVPPGCLLEYDIYQTKTEIRQYWSLPDNLDDIASLDDAIEEFKNIFNSSIDLRLRSDVPVGLLLSGGLDSSSIACNLHSRQTDKQFFTYSAIFEEAEFSEEEFIKKVLKKNKRLAPNFVKYNAHDVTKCIENLVWSLDFPFRSLAVFSQHLLYEKIHTHGKVTVLLNGQGADEIFAGYSEYNITRLSSLLLRFRLLSFFEELASLKRISNIYYKNLLRRVFIYTLKHLRQFVIQRRCYDIFEARQKEQLFVSALPEYLRYEDRNSMAFGKEARLPFLDYRLVEFAFKLPESFKVDKGQRKLVQRKSVSSYVPEEIVKSHLKMGFISPQELWQQNGPLKDWVEARHQLFDKPKCMNQVKATTWTDWRLACFNEWRRVYDV